VPRPKRCRRIASLPNFALFKPAGVPGRILQEVELTVDEYEALRLADYEGLYHEKAAERMGVPSYRLEKAKRNSGSVMCR